jgi:hypothetical protein
MFGDGEPVMPGGAFGEMKAKMSVDIQEQPIGVSVEMDHRWTGNGKI